MMKISEDLNKLFTRDLDRLHKEIESYNNEDSIWIINGEVKNSAGNLALHLCGNLQHFIAHVLNGSDYKRDREFEFSGKRSKVELLQEIENTKEAIQSYFEKSVENAFDKPYPIEVFGHSMTVSYFLIHLQGHLNYHLGQINYHRRLIKAAG